jgi:hypothetical protein
MKPTAVFLTASLAANAVLCLVVATRLDHVTDSSSAAKSSVYARAGAAADASADTLDPETWSELTTGDNATLVERLRDADFPLSLQRAILAALITERFADRHKALAALISAQPWWRGGFNASADGAKILATRQQLQRDEKDALEQLLGPDAGLSDYARARQTHAYGGDLSPAKMSELDRINSDYAELIAEVRNASQGILLPEDRAKLAYLQQEQRADIAKLLTPDELLDYDLRSSPTAGQLRNQLAAFNPTEDEFRALFKIQQAFDAQYGNPDLLSADQRRARNAAQADLLKQAEAVLPPDRFATLKLTTDPSYLAANAVITRLQLPATATADIVAVQKDITTRAQAISADKSLTPDQRNSQLTALGSEAVVRLTPTLGDAGLAAYKQSGGGWINNLQHPPAPPPAPSKP